MATFTGNPNFTATGTGAATRPAADVIDEFVFASNFSGYDPTGATDSSAAIMAADAAARTRNRILILTGTPRIISTLVINYPTHWRMQGGNFKPGLDYTGSAILKDSDLKCEAIEIAATASGTILEGVVLLGEEGNDGDGFYIRGNQVSLIECGTYNMGENGCRIGAKSAGGGNANGWRLQGCSFGYNVCDGLHIDDLSGGPDANAGLADGLSSVLNGGHGLYIDHGILGNTFVAPLLEGNAGYGLYLDSNASNNVFIGGDIEGNNGTDPQIYEDVLFANRFLEVTRQGYPYNNMLQNGTFTPVVVGSTGAGTGDYVTQKGFYVISGHSLEFMIELVWSAHTGTGDLRIGLTGLPVGPDDINGAIPGFVPVAIYSDAIGFTSGAYLAAIYNHNLGQILVSTSNGGATTMLPMKTSGILYLRGTLIPSMPA
jgi:hypothetical protein